MQSYQVLARSWRPKRLAEVVGQPLVVRLLTHALDQNRFPSAALFAGHAGVGKTTLCRIISKCLNCESGVSAVSCEVCEPCKAIESAKCLDFYEIDAASRTKVEDIRELLEHITYPPLSARYKIYLIDEIHMLSQHSINALLKTLEEPPHYAKFLLATTDPKRLPVTLLSRCLQFHLHCISAKDIGQQLEHICIQEQIQYEPSALIPLSKAAKGSMRDALSLLDQAIIYGNHGLVTHEVEHLLGSVTYSDLIPIFTALAQQDAKALFKAISQFSEQNPNFHTALEECIHCLHQLAIAHIIPETLSSDHPIAPFIQYFTPEMVQLYYQIGLLGRRDLAYTPNPQQGFEMTLLRMLMFQPYPELDRIQSTPKECVSVPPAPSPSITLPKIAATETQKSEHWRAILEKLELSGMAQALATNCTLKCLSENNITLTLSTQHAPMLHDKLKERIQMALSQYLSRSMQLTIELTHTALMDTPNQHKQLHQEKDLAEAAQRIIQHPSIQKLVQMYDATIDLSLIE